MRARKASAKKRAGKRRSYRWLLKLIGLLAVVGLGWAGWERIPRIEVGTLWPIAYVRLEGGIENLNVDKLHQALLPSLRGGYFSLDMGEIEGAVRTFAWVDEVRVSRVWPDTVTIQLREHKAVARWGENALLNSVGARFSPEESGDFSALPVIYGPPGTETYLLGMLNTLNGKLEPARIASIDMSKRHAWVIKLNNGLEIHLGRQDPVKAMERFLTLAPQLGEDYLDRLKRVDMRYTNGLAVVWKDEAVSGALPQPGTQF
ncbi:MAG: cell division protein FtsQ/DivIB [Methylococcaceae bacterium]|nr:cell division protein FtsQ/DivIB [Methylococcaceae bacterium]